MAEETNNTEDSISDTKEQNFMAEMVEVRVKMYECRVCGIRYDNMEDMKQHYNEVHPTNSEDDPSQSKVTSIKEEIVDDDDVDGDATQANYVIIGEDGQQIQFPMEGLQVLQLAGDGGESGGQILLQVINQDADEVVTAAAQEAEEMEESEEQDHPIGEIVERRPTQQETSDSVENQQQSLDNGSTTTPIATPSRRGRKRKTPLTTSEQKIMTPAVATLASTRSKRMVVPNIKSEFIYEGLSQSVETEEPKQDTSYTFIQEGGVITAFHVTNEVETSRNKLPKIVSPGTGANDDDEESYPADYTPTSKVKKGRQIEPKEDDNHLRRFPCPFQGCKYVAKYRSNLWDHKKTHTGEKPYACNWPSCSMRFSQTHQLKLHLRSHTGERPYVCDWPGCNSAFSQKPGLKSHMLTHTGEKPFKCDFPGCGWTFRLKGALTDHKRAIHENAKKHVCEWPGCNKRFLQQCHLKKHIMGHADIKPFACDWPNCNYKAVTMAYVTNHRKTHTGEKNYECTYPNCNKRFVKSSHVNRHRQRCHPELFMVDIVPDDIVMNDSGGEDFGEEHEDEEHDEAVASIQPSDSSSSTDQKQSQTTRGGMVTYKLAASNQNGGEEDEENSATIYLQQEDVQEEIVGSQEVDGENVQYINGSVSVSESGQHYIQIADPNSSDGQQLMIELKKEKMDDNEESSTAVTSKNSIPRVGRMITRSRGAVAVGTIEIPGEQQQKNIESKVSSITTVESSNHYQQQETTTTTSNSERNFLMNDIDYD